MSDPALDILSYLWRRVPEQIICIGFILLFGGLVTLIVIEVVTEAWARVSLWWKRRIQWKSKI